MPARGRPRPGPIGRIRVEGPRTHCKPVPRRVKPSCRHNRCFAFRLPRYRICFRGHKAVNARSGGCLSRSVHWREQLSRGLCVGNLRAQHRAAVRAAQCHQISGSMRALLLGWKNWPSAKKCPPVLCGERGQRCGAIVSHAWSSMVASEEMSKSRSNCAASPESAACSRKISAGLT